MSGGLIEPRRGQRDLDLGDGKTPLKLWYPPGAIYRLLEELKVDIPFHRLSELNDHLTPRTLPIFLWAGRLWEDRDLKVQEIRERVDWAPVSLVKVNQVVQEAMGASMLAQDQEEETGPDPTKPPPTDDGGGATPSGLH